LPLPPAGLQPAQIGRARRLDSPHEIRNFAKEWQNCLERYLSNVERGECDAVVIDDDSLGAIAEIPRVLHPFVITMANYRFGVEVLGDALRCLVARGCSPSFEAHT